ncbi:hypothetical protein OC846_000050 [Tilletia horrida]|uniref:Uncharacterized protein n=1 Tax=Tilletia horrida TaxID=155126 RepID=A0AAN6H1I6_9BASI|nr:hypothetical protein OC846_000050 [Tilletia horrida]KAK0569195.1 hypothetical protein OC861_001231 [Tilletia horrida]
MDKRAEAAADRTRPDQSAAIPDIPAPAYSEFAPQPIASSSTPARKPLPPNPAAAAPPASSSSTTPIITTTKLDNTSSTPRKPLPIPYRSSPTSPNNAFLISPTIMSSNGTYPPAQLYPNPHTTAKGEHDYTDAYNNHTAIATTSNGADTSLANAHSSPSPEPATGPTKGVGVPSSYNAFVSFPLLSPWYPSTAKPNDYHDPKVSGPRSFPPPLSTRGLTESRFMQIQHYACSIRADSQRNKGLLCCSLGLVFGGLGCVLIDNKCVGNTPLRDKVNRWAFENVNPRLEHEGVDVRFAYQKGALRAYFKD